MHQAEPNSTDPNIVVDAAPMEHDHTLAHPVPMRVLVGVFLALLVLTVVTVAATWIDLGNANLAIAMAIATVKALLVALYFMHLRYDQPFNALVFVVGLVFVTLFLSLTLLDTGQYQADLIPMSPAGVAAPAVPGPAPTGGPGAVPPVSPGAPTASESTPAH